MTLREFFAALGQLLAPIIEPILQEALTDAFNKFMEDTAVVGKPNDALQQLWMRKGNPG